MTTNEKPLYISKFLEFQTSKLLTGKQKIHCIFSFFIVIIFLFPDKYLGLWEYHLPERRARRVGTKLIKCTIFLYFFFFKKEMKRNHNQHIHFSHLNLKRKKKKFSSTRSCTWKIIHSHGVLFFFLQQKSLTSFNISWIFLCSERAV